MLDPPSQLWVWIPAPTTHLIEALSQRPRLLLAFPRFPVSPLALQLLPMATDAAIMDGYALLDANTSSGQGVITSTEGDTMSRLSMRGALPAPLAQDALQVTIGGLSGRLRSHVSSSGTVEHSVDLLGAGSLVSLVSSGSNPLEALRTEVHRLYSGGMSSNTDGTITRLESIWAGRGIRSEVLPWVLISNLSLSDRL